MRKIFNKIYLFFLEYSKQLKSLCSENNNINAFKCINRITRVKYKELKRFCHSMIEQTREKGKKNTIHH
jgi:hypothetical protein